MQTRAEGHIVVDALREGVGLLKHDPDASAEIHHVGASSEHVEVSHRESPRGSSSGNGIVHPVDPSQQRAFAAAAGADQGRDSAARDAQVDVVQSLKVSVPRG